MVCSQRSHIHAAPREKHMCRISLESAIAISEHSKRTWWRRISSGTVARAGLDSRGRATVAIEDVLKYVTVPLSPEEVELLIRADGGDAASQNDAAQLFDETGLTDAALYWWRAAAEQGHPDAMQNLGFCYAAGKGVPKDNNLSVMWIAKSAAFGHPIAAEQMARLSPYISPP